MNRSVLVAGTGAIVVALVVGVVVLGKNLSAPSPRSTPTSTPPAPTQTISPVIHPTRTPAVHLAADYKAFINTICHGLRTHSVAALQNHLEYYQYNSGLYYGNFNKAEGYFASVSLLGQWLGSGNQGCVRVAPSFQGHGVLATRGWVNQYGTWCLLDLDKLRGAWKIDDFTYGTYRQVMGSFFANDPVSVRYTAKV